MNDNFEIIFNNFKRINIDNLIYEYFKISNIVIVNSHFYDEEADRDLEFSDIKSISEYFIKSRNACFSIKTLELGILLSDVVILINSDNENGEIVINFPVDTLFSGIKKEVGNKCEKILNCIREIKEKYNFETLIMGFEPATDDDMCLVKTDTINLKLIENLIGWY